MAEPTPRRDDRSGRAGSRTLAADDRAVSTMLSYILTLSITAILISGLLLTGGNVVETQQERTAQSELRVIGQQVAADLNAADRLADATDAGQAAVSREYPDRVVGTTYTIAVDGSAGEVLLEADRFGVRVTVPFVTETPVADATVSGGDVVVTYQSGPDELEVTND